MNKGMIPNVIHRFNLYLRTDRLFGHTGEVELPGVNFLTDSIEGAGVGGNLEVVVAGLTENMEMTIPYTCISAETGELLDPTEPLDLTLRGGIQAMDQSTGKIGFKPLKVVVRGFTKSYSPGTVKAGQKMSGSITANLTYNKIVFDDKTLLEIDKLNDVCTINGKDVLKEVRDMC